MKKFSIVRVYSKTLERNAYPIPRTLTVTGKCTVLPDEVDHEEPPDTVLLHKLIRDQKSPLYEQINAMDKRISADPRGIDISDKELEDYKRQIAKAEQHVLTKADVVLCTCSESASKRIRGNNIQQVALHIYKRLNYMYKQNLCFNLLSPDKFSSDYVRLCRKSVRLCLRFAFFVAGPTVWNIARRHAGSGVFCGQLQPTDSH